MSVPSLRNLSYPGIEPVSPALQADSLLLSHLGSPTLQKHTQNWSSAKEGKKRKKAAAYLPIADCTDATFSYRDQAQMGHSFIRQHSGPFEFLFQNRKCTSKSLQEPPSRLEPTDCSNDRNNPGQRISVCEEDNEHEVGGNFAVWTEHWSNPNYSTPATPEKSPPDKVTLMPVTRVRFKQLEALL